MRLRDLYDADVRNTNPQAYILCSSMPIPHPLCGIDYADGMRLCRRSTCPRCPELREKERERTRETYRRIGAMFAPPGVRE